MAKLYCLNSTAKGWQTPVRGPEPTAEKAPTKTDSEKAKGGRLGLERVVCAGSTATLKAGIGSSLSFPSPVRGFQEATLRAWCVVAWYMGTQLARVRCKSLTSSGLRRLYFGCNSGTEVFISQEPEVDRHGCAEMFKRELWQWSILQVFFRIVDVLVLKDSYPGKLLSPSLTRVVGHFAHCSRSYEKRGKTALRRG